MSDCQWTRVQRRTPQLTEWKCTFCGQEAYSSNQFAPETCRRQLKSGYIKPVRPAESSHYDNRPSNRHISFTFYMIISICAGIGWLVWSGNSNSFLIYAFFFLIMLIQLCFHEYGHAITAYIGGDRSVEKNGYLSINPLKYTHPVYSVALPMVFVIIGAIPILGGAVYIDFGSLKNKYWASLVSAAGLAFNAISVIVVILIMQQFQKYDNYVFWSIIAFSIYIQIALILLNLIPVPGLDGYGIIESWLPKPITEFFRNNPPLTQILPIAFILIPNPVVDHIWETSAQLSTWLGVRSDLVEAGRTSLSIDALSSAIFNSFKMSATPAVDSSTLFWIVGAVVVAFILIRAVISHKIPSLVRKRTAIGFAIALAAVSIYPLINESSTSSCAALEKRFVVELSRVPTTSDNVGAVMLLYYAGSLSDGAFASGYIKSQYPDLPPFIGCYVSYYQLIIDKSSIRKLSEAVAP